MCGFHVLLVIGVVLISNCHAQVIFGVPMNVKLTASQAYQIKFKAPTSINSQQGINIVIRFSELQQIRQPQTTVITKNGIKACFGQNVGDKICYLSPKDIENSTDLTLRLLAVIDCTATIVFEVRQTIKIDFATTYQIAAIADDIVNLQLQVPNIQFSSIIIKASLKQEGTALGKLSMIANYGSQQNNITIPTTQQDAQVYAIALWQDQIGLILSNQQINPNDYIKIALRISKEMVVTFHAAIHINGTTQLKMSNDYKDYLAAGQSRIYILSVNTNNKSIINQNDTINFYSSFYSGQAKLIVSFDSTFDNPIGIYDFRPVMSISITPKDREQNTFNGNIYLKIQAYWACDYLISIRAYKYDDSIPLIDHRTQIIQLTAGQIQNYVIVDTFSITHQQVSKTKRQYTINFELLNGYGVFDLVSCPNYFTNSFKQCFIKQWDQLSDENKFDQIQFTIQRFLSNYMVVFQYPVQKCKIILAANGIDWYKCAFIIPIQGRSQQAQMLYQVTYYGPQLSQQLQQGMLMSSVLMEQRINYYEFVLPKLDSVIAIQVQLAVIQGDAIIYGSIIDSRPNVYNIDNGTIFTGPHLLIFTQNNLATTNYIAVQAFQRTKYTLLVLVRRKQSNMSDDSEISTIPLNINEIKSFQFRNGVKQVDYKFTTYKKATYIIQIQIQQGQISYQLESIDSNTNNHKKITFDHASTVAKTKMCQFTSTDQQNVIYNFKIKNNSSKLTSFNIHYFKTYLPNNTNNNKSMQQSCVFNPIGIERSLDLQNDQKGCTMSVISRIQNLEIVLSLSQLQLIQYPIKIGYRIGNSSSLISLNGRSIKIRQEQIKSICATTLSYCPIYIYYQNVLNTPRSFRYILRYSTDPIDLFQGIVQKVTVQQITSTTSKNFTYQFKQQSNIRIHFTQLTDDSLFIAAKIVSLKTYWISQSSLFPSGPLSQSLDTNTYISYGMKSYTFIINSKTFTTNNCQKQSCIALISVYKYKSNKTSFVAFQIMASQKQIDLSFGQSKTILLQEGDQQVYVIQANPVQQSALVLDYVQKIQSGEQCAIIKFMDSQGNDFSKLGDSQAYYFVKAGVQKYQIMLSTQQKQCLVRMSYQSLKNGVLMLYYDLGRLVSLKEEQLAYFLYYHDTKDSFYLRQIIESGDSQAYATPLITRHQLANALNMNLDSFKFKQKDGQLSVLSNSVDFKSNSYYLIAVKGKPTVKQQLFVTTQSIHYINSKGYAKSILSDNHKNITYQYWAYSNYELQIIIRYGAVKLTVQDQKKMNVFDKIVSKSDKIPIKFESVDDSYYSQYLITFSLDPSSVSCSFTVKINASERYINLIQGYPQFIYFSKNTVGHLQFASVSNIQPISLSIQLYIEQEQELINSPLQLHIVRIDNTGITQNVNWTIQRAGTTYSAHVTPGIGTYYLNLTRQQFTSGQILLIKGPFSLLQPSIANYLSEQHIFQIYTPPKSKTFIQVFNCKGSVQITASDDLLFAQASSEPIILQHSNVGGHYVVVPKTDGDYFIKINNRHLNKQNISYKIAYYQYNIQDKLPYDYLAYTSPSIIYNIRNGTIVFNLQPIRLKGQTTNSLFGKISYTVYVTDCLMALQLVTQCSVRHYNRLFKTLEFDSLNSQSSSITTSFQMEQFSQREQFKNSSVFWVSAIGTIQIKGVADSDEKLKQLRIIYEPAQILKLSQAISEIAGSRSSRIIQVIIIIVVIIATVLILIFIAKCMKQLRRAYPTQLIQQDIVQGTENKMKQSHQKQALRSADNQMKQDM